MKWILIFIGLTSFTAEFDDHKACRSAADEIAKHAKGFIDCKPKGYQ